MESFPRKKAGVAGVEDSKPGDCFAVSAVSLPQSGVGCGDGVGAPVNSLRGAGCFRTRSQMLSENMSE